MKFDDSFVAKTGLGLPTVILCRRFADAAGPFSIGSTVLTDRRWASRVRSKIKPFSKIARRSANGSRPLASALTSESRSTA